MPIKEPGDGLLKASVRAPAATLMELSMWLVTLEVPLANLAIGGGITSSVLDSKCGRANSCLWWVSILTNPMGLKFRWMH